MLSKSFGGDNCKSETHECESRMRGIQSCTALAPNITYKKLVEVGRGMTRVQNHVHTHRAKTTRGDKLTVNIEHVDFTTACGFFGRHPSYHLFGFRQLTDSLQSARSFWLVVIIIFRRCAQFFTHQLLCIVQLLVFPSPLTNNFNQLLKPIRNIYLHAKFLYKTAFYIAHSTQYTVYNIQYTVYSNGL